MAGVFKEAVLTAKGIALLAKAQAGRCTIKLTKAATGDGSYSDGEALTNRTALKSKKQEFALITVTTQNQSNVYVKFIITNKQDTGNLKNGYYVKEVGIYAQDPDEGEILYALAVGVANQWDYMPAYNDLLHDYHGLLNRGRQRNRCNYRNTKQYVPLRPDHWG